MTDNFGTFTKNGETRVATDAGQAVALRFDGWGDVETGELKGSDLDQALTSAGLDTSGTAAEKRARLTK